MKSIINASFIVCSFIVLNACAGSRDTFRDDNFAMHKTNENDMHTSQEIPDNSDFRTMNIEQTTTSDAQCELNPNNCKTETSFVFNRNANQVVMAEQRRRDLEELTNQTVQEAKHAAERQEFALAIRLISRTKESAPDEKGETLRREFIEQLADEAMKWMNSIIQQDDSVLSPGKRVEIYQDCEFILKAIPRNDSDLDNVLRYKLDMAYSDLKKEEKMK